MWYHVDLIPQESGNTCWAAAMAMLLSYLSPANRGGWSTSPFRARFTPAQVASLAGERFATAYAQNRMLTSSQEDNFRLLARPWRLAYDWRPRISGLSDWEQLLDQYGPVFASCDRGDNDHCVVVAGTQEGNLLVVDPSPPRAGRRDRWLVDEASGDRVGVIIHWAPGTDVMPPGRGGG